MMIRKRLSYDMYIFSYGRNEMWLCFEEKRIQNHCMYERMRMRQSLWTHTSKQILRWCVYCNLQCRDDTYMYIQSDCDKLEHQHEKTIVMIIIIYILWKLPDGKNSFGMSVKSRYILHCYICVYGCSREHICMTDCMSSSSATNSILLLLYKIQRDVIILLF